VTKVLTVKPYRVSFKATIREVAHLPSFIEERQSVPVVAAVPVRLAKYCHVPGHGLQRILKESGHDSSSTF
jgi:hypothetical protein